MSDIAQDWIDDAERDCLGMSARDFEQFLLTDGYLTDLELRVNPAIVSKLMNRDEVWESYRRFAMDRYSLSREDERSKWGHL